MSGHGLQPLGAAPPGGVYLCQVGGRVSCGACCGLYNVADPGQEALTALLARRSAAFSTLAREPQALLDFAEENGRREDPRRPLPEFHHCPFLGLLGEPSRQRVACLLHPMAAGNRGIDWRGLSDYGGMACRVYFCHSHSRLPAAVKSLLRACADNWYDYGLTITETRLIAAFFEALARRMGGVALPDPQRLAPDAIGRLRAFLALKAAWPYRSPEFPLAHDPFTSPDRPRAAAGERLALHAPSPFDTLLRELGTHFENAAQQRQGEARLEALIDGLAAALEKG